MDNGTTLDETLIRENLRKARNSRGLTQSKVAESLDISLTAYQKIESGKTRIINPHFTKCADTFGVSLSELVSDGDVKTVIKCPHCGEDITIKAE